VAPIGHPAPLRSVIDIDLAAHPRVWAGGGGHFTRFAATYDEFVRITGERQPSPDPRWPRYPLGRPDGVRARENASKPTAARMTRPRMIRW
jgi:hypothetical protein